MYLKIDKWIQRWRHVHIRPNLYVHLEGNCFNCLFLSHLAYVHLISSLLRWTFRHICQSIYIPMPTFVFCLPSWYVLQATVLLTFVFTIIFLINYFIMKFAVFWGITRRRVVIVYRRFGTTCRSHLCPETSVYNYHMTPCNTPEDHRFHQHRGGSLKSRLFYYVYFWV
jgi:hypothetical protein